MALFPMATGGGTVTPVPANVQFTGNSAASSASKYAFSANTNGIKKIRLLSSTGYSTINIATDENGSNVIGVLPTYPTTLDLNVENIPYIYAKANAQNSTYTYTITVLE